MTEDEARAKWCPFVRVMDVGGGIGPITNRLLKPEVKLGSSAEAWSRCIGSKCAAWRKAKRSKGDGFCGLAGVPQ